MNEQSLNHHWHASDAHEALKRLDVSEDGLSKAQAGERLEKAGPNTLEVEEGSGPLTLLLRQIHNPLIYLLAGAAVLSLFVGHQVDAAVIAGVIVLNTLLGFIQEWRAEGALAALRRMASPHARVLRDAGKQDIEAADVVPGDILILETGDRVAADARVIWSEDLQVDESALTGESVPVAKNSDVLEKDTPMADQKNVVRMSTSITGGRGRAVVTATGMTTEIGRIAAEVFSVGLLSNRWLLLGVGIAIILQIGAVQSPLGHWLLGTVGLTPGDWLLIVLVSSSIWIADELFKLMGVYRIAEKKGRRISGQTS